MLGKTGAATLKYGRNELSHALSDIVRHADLPVVAARGV